MKIKGKEYTDISKLSVRPISKSVAKDIIIKNHYSGIWTKVSYCLGLYVECGSSEHRSSPLSNSSIGLEIFLFR